eukprot:4214915-Amphidinium_carterae.2
MIVAPDQGREVVSSNHERSHGLLCKDTIHVYAYAGSVSRGRSLWVSAVTTHGCSMPQLLSLRGVEQLDYQKVLAMLHSQKHLVVQAHIRIYVDGRAEVRPAQMTTANILVRALQRATGGLCPTALERELQVCHKTTESLRFQCRYQSYGDDPETTQATELEAHVYGAVSEGSMIPICWLVALRRVSWSGPMLSFRAPAQRSITDCSSHSMIGASCRVATMMDQLIVTEEGETPPDLTDPNFTKLGLTKVSAHRMP